MTSCTAVYQTKGVSVDQQRQVCAGGQEANDTCFGQPGSPLMHIDPPSQNWRLAGVVSYGPSECSAHGFPAVYTRISEYTDWIVDKLIHELTLSTLKT